MTSPKPEGGRRGNNSNLGGHKDILSLRDDSDPDLKRGEGASGSSWRSPDFSTNVYREIILIRVKLVGLKSDTFICQGEGRGVERVTHIITRKIVSEGKKDGLSMAGL